MTKEERRLIRTCLCNGFEFHSRNEEGGTGTVKIGDEVFDFDRLNELVLEVENALEKQTPKKPFQKYKHINEYTYCANCGEYVSNLYAEYKPPYCKQCGQALDWSEEE